MARRHPAPTFFGALLRAAWGLPLAATLLGLGACTAIIGAELDGKPPEKGTGGAAVDGGGGAGGGHGCATAADCTALPNAQPACSAGTCVLGPCLAGYQDCNGLSADGCEVDVQKSPLDCGTCGNACSLLHASAACVAGQCAIVSCAAGFADCDHIVDNGCEVDSQGDVDNCGACGKICMLPSATPACQGGSCKIAACAAGFLDCDALAADGCEVARSTDLQNCGGCGVVCALPHAKTTCAAGACLIDTCDAGYADCNGLAADGCETDLQSSATSCGACGSPCSQNHATPTCTSGACTLACAPGFADCDGNVANGCEAETSANVNNCGGCGQVCPAVGGTPTCIGGACGVSTCTTGWASCTGPGCGTPITTISNCGGCGLACSTPNGTPACVSGACATGACNAGFADCNGLAIDGCETSTRSLSSCGACGQTCNLPHANPTCASGTCAVSSCMAPFADCDGSPANGCEADTSSSVASCGACGVACNATNGTPSCSAGACSITCATGFGDCNGNAADGCEINLKTDPAHCGGCSVVCSLPNAVAACSNGTCAVGSCVAPFADCDGLAANGCETDTSKSPTACGGCGHACGGQNGTATCAASACGITCDAGYANCDGTLANGCEAVLTSDVSNCGACGHVCPSSGGTPYCVAGVCGVSSCPPGMGDCSGTGCTTNLASDPQNCGACGNACAVANGTGACSGAKCVVAGCNPGFADCDGQYADGCEVNLRTLADCGACGAPCALANATSSCAGGTCAVVSCTGTFADCNGVAADGCEVDLATSAGHCGACGNACSTVNATATCVASHCVLACAAGFGDCDMNVTNGCETDTRTSVRDCGACGRACAATNVASLACSAGLCDATCAPGFGNCSEPSAPAVDDGCETNVSASATSCGSCGNDCSLQGPASAPLVCAPKPNDHDRCGCSAGAQCSLAGANGTCKGNGACACNGTVCNLGEVCAHLATDVCSCNGGSACGASQTCCQTPAGCVDLTSTAGSCGACGHACPPGFSCLSSACKCTASAQCNAGAAGTCTSGGACQCGATVCAAGQRCQPGGSCG